MNRDIRKVSTLGMSREDWLALRRKSIGGSDAGAIVGLSKWATPYTVWLDKTGKLPEKEDTEAMRQGRDLEQYVAQRFAEETGKRVRRENAILYNPAYPFASANVDRLIIGEKAGLECKTTNTLDLKQFQDVEFPKQYYAQCVHYLAVTGLERWYLAVLVYGRGFYIYTLERDEAEIAALMGAEARFWELVENNTPPPPDGSQAATEAIKAVFAEDDGETVDLFGRESVLSEYMALKAKRSAVDERIAEIENIIKADMADASSASCGRYIVSWKSQTRSTFQHKAFAKDHPKIDLTPYFKASTSRPFKVTENKEDL